MDHMKKRLVPELLAPAGSRDSMIAAVSNGADAVYMGGGNFNARAGASNFVENEMLEAIDYCHVRGVKTYITLNTIIKEAEIESVLKFVSQLNNWGADGVIVQDLATAKLVKNLFPSLPLHASTQMTIQNLGGIKLLKKLGFSRAILPRELSMANITELANEDTGVELEVFVHGALCVSYSGQCLMSSMIGGRSGNRGKCAQPCRLEYSMVNENGVDIERFVPGNYLLSPRDLMSLNILDRLVACNVASLKIEGRMKRPEYVAAAVTSCRNELDNTKNEKIEKSLRAVFSRSGFTDGYYLNQRGKDMFGTREKDDVVAAKDVLGDLARLYEKETPRFKVDFDFFMRENEKISLCAACGEINIKTDSDCVAEKAIKREINADDIREQLSKLGGTPFYAGEIIADIQKGLSIPISAINKLRRDAVEKLQQKILEANTPQVIHSAQQTKKDLPVKKQAGSQQKTYLIFSNKNQVPDDISNDYILVFPLNASEKLFEKYLEKGNQVCAELPRGIFGNAEAVEKKSEKLFNIGVKRFFCPTIDSAVIAKKIGADITASFGSNIFNSFSLDVWKNKFADEAILSAEMTTAQMNKISGDIRTGLICYGKLPLMLTRNCPMNNTISCDKCKKTGALTDRKGFAFPIDCSSGCSEILNSVPIYMCDRISEFENADFFVLKFTTETKDECTEILANYKTRSKAEKKYTRGLYQRGVI